MKKIVVFALAAVLSFVARAYPMEDRDISLLLPQDLRVEELQNPVGIGTQTPRFSWTFAPDKSGRRGLSQSGYRILVASTPGALDKNQADVWDSGRVQSKNYILIEYAGKPLRSHTNYYWKLRTWDQDGRASAWTVRAKWSTGLLQPSDWKAKWIAAEPDGASDTPAIGSNDSKGNPSEPMPIFRRDFSTRGPVRSALVYISGLGQYELDLNGKNVTDTVLNPGWTNYRKAVLYNSYDISTQLRHGANTFAVMLGNGMYNVPNDKNRYHKFSGFFGQPKFILQLHVTYADGSEETLISDGSWKTTAGPIVFSSTYGGEDYDARREIKGWNLPGLNDAAWKQALEVQGPGGNLMGNLILPIRVARTFRPVRVRRVKPGLIVYDLGQNFSGWPAITIRGHAGDTVRLFAGELLKADGTVTQHSADVDPEAPNLFTYTLKGGEAETWHPRFSYWGFRYVQAQIAAHRSGDPLPVLVSVAGQYIHADAPQVGRFSSSKLLFNQIHGLIDSAILSNMVSLLTDCPHREKLGWLEQTHLAGPSVMLNYDVARIYQKIEGDMGDAQQPNGLVPDIAPEYVKFLDDNGGDTYYRDSPEWGSAVILSPWIAYQYYGDRRILADHYEEMRKYAAYLSSRAKDHFVEYGMGDWYDIGPRFPGESQLTVKGLTSTAIYYQDLTTLARVAEVLGRAQEAREIANEASLVKDSFNAKLFHADSDSYDRGSQTAQAMPFVLGMVPQGHEAGVLKSLIEDIRAHGNHVTAGDIGFHYVVRALSDGGRSDVLDDMLSRTDSPSYGYQLAKGATTLTEAWDTNPASSQNHFMLGHGEEWFYRGLAGIDFDLSRMEPERIMIHPRPVGDIEKVSASYRSSLGTIKSSWQISGATFVLDIAIPPGATAAVHVPTSNPRSLREGGDRLQNVKGISSVQTLDDGVTFLVGSGRYHLAAEK